MKRFKKVTWRGQEDLCVTNEQEKVFICVTNPMVVLVKGEDKFTAEDIENLSNNEYEFKGEKVKIIPQMYGNGFIAITVAPVGEPSDYDVITVNLEEMDAFSIPRIIWPDINNCPESEEFLCRTKMARKTPMKRSSGFVNYPVMFADMVKVYAHNPELFEKCDLVPDPDRYKDEDEE